MHLDFFQLLNGFLGVGVGIFSFFKSVNSNNIKL